MTLTVGKGSSVRFNALVMVPLDSEIGTASEKSHFIGIAHRVIMWAGISACGCQLDRLLFISTTFPIKRPMRPLPGEFSVTSATTPPIVASATFCRAVNRSPHWSIPYRCTRNPSVPIGGNGSSGTGQSPCFPSRSHALKIPATRSCALRTAA